MKITRIPCAMWRDAARFIFEGRRLVPTGAPGESLVIHYEEETAEYFKGLCETAKTLGWGEVKRSPNGNLRVRLLGDRAARELLQSSPVHQPVQGVLCE